MQMNVFKYNTLSYVLEIQWIFSPIHVQFEDDVDK